MFRATRQFSKGRKDVVVEGITELSLKKIAPVRGRRLARDMQVLRQGLGENKGAFQDSSN